jgi:hypothetical protein
MDADSCGDFIEDTCPECFIVVLGEEGLFPNVAEATRVAEARAAIDAWREAGGRVASDLE